MKQKSLLKTMLLLCALMAGSGSAWADEFTLTNAKIVAAGDGDSGYKSWSITDDNSKTWKAYAIKNQHSKATSSYHFLQIKKYASNTAYYIQVPEFGTKITSITMTVSGASQPMDGGSNSATLHFSNSNSTSSAGAGVASGTGGSSVTIDCSSLNLNTGYITAGGAVRIWDVKVTYSSGPVTPTVATPTFDPTGGTYTSAQSVTISCETDDASIYYTTNGDTPTAESTKYTGAISVTTATTIKAIAVKSEMNNSAVASATYTIEPNQPTFSEAPGTVAKGTEVTISAETGCTLSYTTDGTDPSTSSTAMMTADNTATVTINTFGTTTLRAIALDSYANESAEASATYTVEKYEPDLSFGATTSFTCDLLNDFTAPTLTAAEGWNGTATYSSSDEDVAMVNETTGEVELMGVGEVTITATAEATANFKAGNTSYTLIVTVNPSVDPITPSSTSGKFVKVTSTGDIVDGQYLIVYGTDGVAFNGGLETLDAGHNTINVSIVNGEIAETTENIAAVFTIDVTNGTLKSASDKYIGVPSNDNALKTSNDEDTYKNSFSIDNSGNAVIKAVFNGSTSSTMSLRFNSASGDNNYRFRYYKNNSQQAIQLYKYVPGASSTDVTVKLSAYGYKTLVATSNFNVSGAKAYIVTAASSMDGVTLEEITTVPANKPVILYGNPDADATLNFTSDDADEKAIGNKLSVSVDGVSYNDNYVLANSSEGVGFYKWAGGTLGAGRVYLPKEVLIQGGSADSRQFLPFIFGDAQGISATLNNNETKSNVVFDLQGRRVLKPAKGLYIMDGRKVMVK